MKIKEIKIKEIIRELEENAFYGKEHKNAYLYNNSNIVELRGYIYEPSYECFSTAHSITMNGEILFARKAKNVAPYHNEVYVYGKFKTTEEAIKHIEEYFGEQEIVLQYDKPNIETNNNSSQYELEDELEV